MTHDWSTTFAESLGYDAFLDRHASPEQRVRWNAVHSLVALDDAQRELLGAFTRRMRVLVLNGAWCGDCIHQCPILDHFARASRVIELRFLDRDARPAVTESLMINGGRRVPVAVFLSEDFQEVARFGDRTLAGYRRLAAAQLGPSCPTGAVPPDSQALAAVTREWLEQFERAQLILRLSARLRQIHND
jgi:thiol-disulfide isomerase/thioredoxin